MSRNCSIILSLNRSTPSHEMRAVVFGRLYSKAKELNGLVSGEHGIGYAKKAYMEELLDDMSIELMRRIKKAFDPQNTLNPGKVI